MPQINKEERKEYNRKMYLKRKTITEEPTVITVSNHNTIQDNYSLLKFYKNIQIVNIEFKSVILKPICVSFKTIYTNCMKSISNVKPINFYNIVLLELKTLVKTKPIDGRFYNYGYANIFYGAFNRRHRSYDLTASNNQIDKDVKDYIIKRLSTDDDITEVSYYRIKQILCNGTDTYYSDLFKIRKIKTNSHHIKVKYMLDEHYMEKPTLSSFSIMRFKNWNTTTKLTSNKGLSINNFYRTFESIKLDDLQHFCFQNGLNKKISKNYKYGNYAEWVYHTLE
jgi:hypothetical protein